MSTNVDELFKRPLQPSTGSLKRKLEVPDAEAAYKASKVSSRSSPNGDLRTNGHASVEDVPEDEDDETEAGPLLPPDEDEEGDDDDDEGRFFGGGVSKDQKEALDYIDEQDGEDELREERIDGAWLRRLATSFEKKVNKNAELRAKYEGDPAKFMQSEADLDAEVKSWSLLSEHPELYLEFAESGAVASLVNLLAHENTDVAIGAIEIISELLDDDVEAEQAQWDALVAALLDADLLELLMSNLGRLDESEETDRSGVYHSLSVIESLASQPSTAEKIGTVKLLEWLCNRMRMPENLISQNKQHAAEVLQVLLQSSPILRNRLAVEVDGVDLFLQLLAAYRKRDPPKDSTEEEYVENLFDGLTCVVDEPAGKAKFVEAEGVELALIMLKEGNFSKPRALRLLDHATGGTAGAAEACEKLVEAAGLKTTFALFTKSKDTPTMEHLLGIFANMLRLLPGESSARIRTLAKFTEKDYERVAKLAQMRDDYARKLAAAEKEMQAEQVGLDADGVLERADEWFSRRLDAGLFCLRSIDVVVAWLCAEDLGVKTHIGQLQAGLLPAVKTSLQEQIAELGEEGETKEMLTTLAGFL